MLFIIVFCNAIQLCWKHKSYNTKHFLAKVYIMY